MSPDENIITNPINASVIMYLSREGRQELAARPAQGSPDAYYRAGSHPEIVARVWDALGDPLPLDCRLRVCGSPALVHPVTGVVFALAMGTQYALRLPGDLAEVAIAAGARRSTTWSNGVVFEVQVEFGMEWVFGAWLQQEPGWCRKACAVYGRPADDEA